MKNWRPSVGSFTSSNAAEKKTQKDKTGALQSTRPRGGHHYNRGRRDEAVATRKAQRPPVKEKRAWRRCRRVPCLTIRLQHFAWTCWEGGEGGGGRGVIRHGAAFLTSSFGDKARRSAAKFLDKAQVTPPTMLRRACGTSQCCTPFLFGAPSQPMTPSNVEHVMLQKHRVHHSCEIPAASPSWNTLLLAKERPSLSQAPPEGRL